MASRFWVGGTGTWDNSSTTHWSATSGGGNGASVPSSSDDVTFDSNSGASATVTIATATANANTITINKSDLTLTHSGVGSTVVGLVTLTTGTLNTNGQTCSWGSFSSTNSNTRTLTLGASSISLTSATTPWDTTTTTNLTFNANTSSISVNGAGVTSASAVFAAGSLTYNSLTFAMTGTNFQTYTLNGSSPTFANLTVTGQAQSGAILLLGTNITVTTSLTMSGATANTQRLIVRSTTIGTARTITNNGSTTTLSNLDLQDITGAGSASWDLSAISGNSGDCGGNSGITFTTARNLFWVGNTSNWSTANKWATSSGGTANQSNPLAQDNITFDSHSFSATGQTVTLNMPRAGKNIDFTNVTNSPTFATSLGAGFNGRIYGSLTFITAMSISGTGALLFEGRASNTYTTANLATTWSLTLQAPGGTLTLVGDFSTSASTANFTVNAGTMTATTSNVTAPAIQLSANSSPVVQKTLNMGSGTWTATGTGIVWNTAGISSLTVNSQTSTIVVSDTSATSKTFSGGAQTYNIVTFSGDNTIISGNNTFNTINVNNAGLTNGGLKFTQTQTQTITNLTTNGSAGNLATIASTGTFATLSKSSGVISIDYTNISLSHAGGGATYYAGVHSTDGGGNTGWIFQGPNSGSNFLAFM